MVKYRQYEITYSGHRSSSEGNYWVLDREAYDAGNSSYYLCVDGTISSNACNGWFKSVEHAKRVINSIGKQIVIGGE